jgi:hypothetical protein
MKPGDGCLRRRVPVPHPRSGRMIRAVGTAKIGPIEVVTDQAPTNPVVLDEPLPAAWHCTERYANNRVEADHGRLKARLGPMRGSSRTTAPTSRSPGRGSYRTYDADGRSLRWRSRRTGGWRSRSTNWPWRSDRGPRRASACSPRPDATEPAGVPASIGRGPSSRLPLARRCRPTAGPRSGPGGVVGRWQP